MVESFWKSSKMNRIGIKPKPIRITFPGNRFNDGLKINSTSRKNAWLGDADGDGVVNIFDCEPHNKRKQGWEHQHSPTSMVVQVPVRRLYNQRGRYGMSNELHAVRIGVEGKEQHQRLAEEKAQKLRSEGYTVKSVGTKGEGYRSYGIVKYARSPQKYQQEIKERMKPMHASSEGFSFAKRPKEAKQYIANLVTAIKSNKPEVELVKVYPKDIQGRGTTQFGEGRHRIVAAMAAGEKTMPVEVIHPHWGEGGETEDWRSEVKAQEARDLQKLNEQNLEQPQTLQSLNDEAEDSNATAGEYEPVQEELDE